VRFRTVILGGGTFLLSGLGVLNPSFCSLLIFMFQVAHGVDPGT